MKKFVLCFESVANCSLLIVALLAFSLFLTAPALADVPKYISFQGELTDSAGTRIATPVSATFKLYNVSTGGASIWTEAQTVSPDQGITNVSLGTVTPFNLPFDTQYWLGIQVGTDAEMSPRMKLQATPYALAVRGITVTETGNVGIGTTNPEAKLHVSGGNILLDNNQLIYFKDLGGAPRQMIQLNTANDLVINGGNAFHTRI